MSQSPPGCTLRGQGRLARETSSGSSTMDDSGIIRRRRLQVRTFGRDSDGEDGEDGDGDDGDNDGDVFCSFPCGRQESVHFITPTQTNSFYLSRTYLVVFI